MRLTFPALARLGMAVIALHNLEEALTMPSWLAPRLPLLEARFGIRPLAEDATRFYPGLVVATVVPVIWILIASGAAPRSAGAYSLLLLYGVFLANAIAPHIVGAVLLGGYVPGLVTAVAIVVPFTIVLARRALVDNYASPQGLAIALGAAFVLYVPVLAVLLGAWSPLT